MHRTHLRDRPHQAAGADRGARTKRVLAAMHLAGGVEEADADVLEATV